MIQRYHNIFIYNTYLYVYPKITMLCWKKKHWIKVQTSLYNSTVNYEIIRILCRILTNFKAEVTTLLSKGFLAQDSVVPALYTSTRLYRRDYNDWNNSIDKNVATSALKNS